MSSQPLPPGPVYAPPPPPPIGYPQTYWQTPPAPPRNQTTVIVVVIVVVVLLVAVISTTVYFAFASFRGSVTVTSVSLESVDNACNLNGMTENGFHANTGASVVQSWTIGPPLNGSSCTVRSVTAVTSGFNVSGTNLPVTVAPGVSGTLSVVIQVPGNLFIGTLTVDVE